MTSPIETLQQALNDLSELHTQLIQERNEKQKEVDKIERKRIKIYHIMKDISDQL